MKRVLGGTLLVAVAVSTISPAYSSDTPRRRAANTNAGPWSLPQTSMTKAMPRGSEFLQECQSLVDFMAQFRGGGSMMGGDDDYYNKNYGEDRYEEDDYYNDNDRPQPSSRRRSSPSMLPNVISKGDKKIGAMMLVAGAGITVVGVSLFFNKTLLRLGNLLCVAGIPVFLGPSSVISYFLKAERIRASGCLALGIFLVFVGWPVFGIVLEVFGLLNLFSNMFPMLRLFLKTIPGVGNLMKSGSSSSRRRDEYEDDQYYNDNEEYGRQDSYGRSDYYDDGRDNNGAYY